MDKYLEWKQIQEDKVKAELGRVRGLINRELRKKQSFLEEEQHIHEEMRQKKSEMGVFDLLGYDRYRRGLKALIKNQDTVLAEIYEEEKKVIARFLAARKEREIVDNLKSIRRKEYDYQVRKQEEKILNEIGVSMSVRRASGDG
jgi:flagellar export protein FliJ